MRILQSVVALLAAATLQAATLESTISFVDGRELFENPGCGYAGGGWSNLTPGMSTSGNNLCSSSRNCTKLWSMHKYSKGYVYGDTHAVQTNHYAHITNFVGGADIPLDANALLAVSNSFLKCRRNGGTCIPRFAYTWDGWGGAEPDDFEMIIVHIHQLGAVLSQFRDVVPAVECGIIGAYGEMHTSRYTAREYQNRVVGAWLESIPDDMALLVRSPQVWMKYLNTTTSAFLGGGMDSMDQILRSRMGFYNDGYLGTDYDYGTWGGGGGTTSWSRDEGRAFLKGQAVPYGGEFASVLTSYFDENVHLLDPSRFNIVSEWYDTHLSYLRTIRAYDMTVVQKLTNTFFLSSAWAFDGMPGLSEYDGVDLRKFCEDHMGYRYVIRGVSLEGRAGGARLDVEIENTGFGQLLFDDLIEVVLSAGDMSVKAPLVGDAHASLRAISTILGICRLVNTTSFSVSVLHLPTRREMDFHGVLCALPTMDAGMRRLGLTEYAAFQLAMDTTSPKERFGSPGTRTRIVPLAANGAQAEQKANFQFGPSRLILAYLRASLVMYVSRSRQRRWVKFHVRRATWRALSFLEIGRALLCRTAIALADGGGFMVLK